MKMLHHKFCALFMEASDFKRYLDERAGHRWDGVGNGNEKKWKRNNKTLLERKIKKMTDSKGIKSNEKTVLGAINRMIFFTVALAIKSIHVNIAFST